MAHASAYDFSGATSQSCKVLRAIRHVYDQPGSIRMRPATVNLLRPDELKTIPQRLELLMPGISDMIPAVSSSPENFGHVQPSV